MITQCINHVNCDLIKDDLDFTERMLAVGLALGPFGHLWYNKIVDKLVPGVASSRTAVKKILADQIVAGPFFCSAFFFGKRNLLHRITSSSLQHRSPVSNHNHETRNVSFVYFL
jgi:hypothetical protein